MQASSSFASADFLSTYLSEISQYPLLTQAEEQTLARRFRQGDLPAGHRLVTANLRFVVKVAYEYRSYGLKMSDLIQEANIGLMKAVQKFDPDKGIRLISYAVWWIRAYIQNYVLKNWSLVKLGTTQAQRRLFFALARTRRELEKLGSGDGRILGPARSQTLLASSAAPRTFEQTLGDDRLSTRRNSGSGPLIEMVSLRRQQSTATGVTILRGRLWPVQTDRLRLQLTAASQGSHSKLLNFWIAP
jgi:RNA polymerase sigma-32 factor